MRTELACLKKKFLSTNLTVSVATPAHTNPRKITPRSVLDMDG